MIIVIHVTSLLPLLINYAYWRQTPRQMKLRVRSHHYLGLEGLLSLTSYPSWLPKLICKDQEFAKCVQLKCVTQRRSLLDRCLITVKIILSAIQNSKDGLQIMSFTIFLYYYVLRFENSSERSKLIHELSCLLFMNNEAAPHHTLASDFNVWPASCAFPSWPPGFSVIKGLRG